MKKLINTLRERKAMLAVQVGALGAVFAPSDGFWHGFFQGFCVAALFIWIIEEVERYQAARKINRINNEECI
jgi:hypothetical protein